MRAIIVSIGLALAANPACGQAPQIFGEHCGATLQSLNGSLFFEPLAGASQHRIRFQELEGGGAGELPPIEVSEVSYFTPAHVDGIRYGRRYRVTIDGKSSGGWTAGASCVLYTPAFPHTRISGALCGSTAPSLATQISADPVPGATDYSFLIEDEEGQTVDEDNPGHPIPHLYTLSWNQALLPGQTYRFYARAKVGGEWRQDYGPGCEITMPSFPQTEIVDCDRQLGSLNEMIRAVPLAEASGYEFEVTDSTEPSIQATLERNHENYWFFHLTWSPFSQFPIKNGHTYTIRVRGLHGGGAGPWSEPCEISTPD